MSRIVAESSGHPKAGFSSLERVLRLFSDVRAGEGRIVALMFANVLLLLCAYYFMKPLREGWLAVSGIDGISKMELKAYSSFGQALLLIGVVSVYSRFVGRLQRQVLITRASGICMLVTAMFWSVQPDFLIVNLPYSGIVFYLWIGMFGVFVIAQFWAFAADLFNDERGRRLLPVIAIGATSGAVVGSWIAKQTVTLGILGTEYLLLASLVPMALCIWLTHLAHQSETTKPAQTEAALENQASGAAQVAAVADAGAAAAIDTRHGAVFVFGSKILLGIALVTLLTNWVNTNGENILFRVIQEAVEEDVRARGIVDAQQVLRFVRDQTTAFYGDFFFWVNVFALFLQALVASRLLKFGGFGTIFLALPVIALISYSVMVLLPVLLAIKIMKIAENATDYSLSNTARHVFWLPFDASVTYKGKPAVDSLFVRFGDGLAAFTVLIGVQVIGLSLIGYLAFNFALAAVWLGLAIWVVIEHRRFRGAHVSAP